MVLSDLDKLTAQETDFRPAPDYSDPRTGAITLQSAGNEVVSCQLALSAHQPQTQLDCIASSLQGPVTIPARNLQLFREHFILTRRNCSYSWGPGGGAGALQWVNRAWPDALIPLRDPYTTTTRPVAAPFDYDPKLQRNQVLWLDVFVPHGTPAGDYAGTITLTGAGSPLRALPLHLKVYPFNLPTSNSLDAYGELYRETGTMFDTQVKFREAPAREWGIYSRYLQLAHAHRVVATHRSGNGPLPRRPDGQPALSTEDVWSTRSAQWDLYSPWVDQVLSGRLFTPAAGYLGPNVASGPSFYPAPFGERFYGAKALREHLAAHAGRLDPQYLATLRQQAAAFHAEVRRRNWPPIRWFAYIFDEVDGKQDQGENMGSAGEPEVVAFHQAMRDVQQALDAGSGEPGFIRLVWTSHQDAAKWSGTPADLAPFMEWWCPNAEATNVNFYPQLATRPGQTVWFYHAGQPFIGNHTINQTGVDMLTWPLMARRYQLDGFFIWSLMSFPFRFDESEDPYRFPVYNKSDTRFGNGVMIYPGRRLKAAGYLNNIDGPVASMRLKALRRGMQDAEYIALAKRVGAGELADAGLRKLLPAGFSAGGPAGKPGKWQQAPIAYEIHRRELAGAICSHPPSSP